MNTRILLIDNYDSFTYNLVQMFGVLGAEVRVAYHDEITVEEAKAWSPSHVVISPGPGRPEDAGVTLDIVHAFLGYRPLLGVCLGHQALAIASGGRVVRAARPMHGKVSACLHDGRQIFKGLPQGFLVGRYHSLVVQPEHLPSCWRVSATTSAGEIMGMAHRQVAAFGVQFHPESIMTPEGTRLMQNFLAVNAVTHQAER